MKTVKKCLAIFLTACLLAGMLPAGAAFASGEGDAACAHENREPVAAVEASCTAAGSAAGEKCSDCGAILSGCETIDALGHDWDYSDAAKAACTRAGCGAVCDHMKEGVSAFADGKCTVCGFACTHENKEPVAVAAKEASCTEDGNTAGTTCAVCGAVCDHTKDGASAFVDGACTVCGVACDHTKDGASAFVDGACTVCGVACDHTKDGVSAFADGVCAVCGLPCQHEELDGNNDCASCGTHIQALLTGGASARADQAQVGSQKYATLQEAIDAMQSDGTITLLENVSLTTLTKFSKDLNVVLDLGGHSLTRTGTGNTGIYVTAGSLTIRNGAVTLDSSADGQAMYIAAPAGVTIEATASVRNNRQGANNYGIYVAGSGASATVYGSVYGYHCGLCVVGDGNGTATADIYGTLSGEYFALSGNGTAHGTLINIYDGASVTSNSTAIYHPQSGTMNIYGGTITGANTGVEVRAGTVNISGGTITGNGDPFGAAGNGNGTTTVGAGLGVVQHNTKLPISVNISGGTIQGKRAIYEDNLQGNSEEDIAKVNVNVTDGSLSGEVYSKDDKVTFSGAAAERPLTTTPTVSGDTATVDNGYIHAGARNIISAGSAEKIVLPKSALEESASSESTTIEIQTDTAEISLDSKALATVNTAAAGKESVTVYVSEVGGEPEKTYVTGLKDADGNEIELGAAGLGDGTATVVIKNVGTEPKQVRHYNSDGSTLIEILPFTYDASAKTLKVTLTSLGRLVLSATAIPAITTEELPAVMLGTAYSTELEATGDTPIKWAVKDGTLPDGLSLSEDGVLSGTVTEETAKGDHTVTLTATNAAGTAEKTYTITVKDFVAAQVLDSDGSVIGEYGTVQEAIDAATEDQTVLLLTDVEETVIVSGNKNIWIDGGAEQHSLKSITVTSGSVAAVENVKADSLTAKTNAGAVLGDGNDIETVLNRNTKPDKDDNGYFVIIVGGHYGTLSPASGAHYLVTGGTFDKEVPMEYCREVEDDGTVIQRCSKYSAAAKAYVIEDFTLKITKVSNSGYHMPGSAKTLVFTTNLPYSLAEPEHIKIINSSNTSVKDLMSSTANEGYYYTITEGEDGMAEITLTARCLNSLRVGKYKLQYEDEVGTAAMYFHISTTVKTGDSSNIGLWIGIAAGSALLLCGVAAVLIMRSRKKNGGEAAAEGHMKRKDKGETPNKP